MEERCVNVEDIMKRIKSEAAARKLDTLSVCWKGLDVFAYKPLGSGGKLTSKGSYHVDELLVPNDEDFIRCAYNAILSREVDSHGLGTYLSLLRSGQCRKTEILWKIRESEEGREKNVEIVGLEKRMKWLKWYRSFCGMPCLGWLTEFFNALFTLPGIARRVAAMDTVYSAKFNDDGKSINACFEDLRLKLNNAFAEFSDKFSSVKGVYEELNTSAGEDRSAFERMISEHRAEVERTVSEHRAEVERTVAEHRSSLASRMDAVEGGLGERLGKLASEIERISFDFLALNHLTKVELPGSVRSLAEKVGGMEGRFSSETLARLIADIERLNGQFIALNHVAKVELPESVRTLTEKVGGMEGRFSSETLARLIADIERLNGQLMTLNHVAKVELPESLRGLSEKLGGLEGRLGPELIAKMSAELESVGKGHLTLNHVVRVENANTLLELMRRAQDHSVCIADLQRRLALMLGELRKSFRNAPGDAGMASVIAGQEAGVLDPLYINFEDSFRGTRGDIKERLSNYIPHVEKALARCGKSPVLDVGAGRCEWLELLTERGIPARGVDLNSAIVAEGKSVGFEIVEADAIEYLRSLKAGTCGVISAFQLVEHLPFKVLVSLFDESLRVLKPGGILIIETPNPENIITASCNFRMDFTHKNPIPAQALGWLAENRGFVRVEKLYVNPNLSGCKEFASKWRVKVREDGSDGMAFTPVENEMLGNLLFGAQDYAVIAVKP